MEGRAGGRGERREKESNEEREEGVLCSLLIYFNFCFRLGWTSKDECIFRGHIETDQS